MIKHLVRLAASTALACTCNAASAGLLGTTVSQCADSAFTGPVSADVSLCAPGTVQPIPASALVGAVVEFGIGGQRLFDFGDATLDVTYIQPVASPSPDLVIFTFERSISTLR